MKQLVCREAGFDCEAVVNGDSVDEVMDQVMPHAVDVHGVTATPELKEQLTGLVKDS